MVGDSTTEGLIVATGHYRNGYLLAPATADAVAGVAGRRPVARGHPALVTLTISPDRRGEGVIIVVNGESREVADGLGLTDLLREMELPPGAARHRGGEKR